MSLYQPLFTAIFLMLCTTLIVLPFMPALREWRRPTDRSSLVVPPRYSSQASFFATAMRQDAQAFAAASDQGQRPQADAFRSAEPVFWRTDLDAAADSSFTALMSAGSIALGPRSRVTEWAHAEGALSMEGPSVSLRRLSAHDRILLREGCCFERLNAPTVEFGSHFLEKPAAHTNHLGHSSYANVAGATRRSAVLHRVDGDCRLEANSHYVGCLVVTGQLVVGSGSIVDGDIQARGGVTLEAESHVRGAVISEGKVVLMADSTASGPVTSEAAVEIAAGVRIGTLESPTTVSAPVIVAQSGSVAHGSIWARQVGAVWRPA